MEEIWRPAHPYEEALEVSNLGRVRTLDRESPTYSRMRNGKIQGNLRKFTKGVVLSPCVGKNGYLVISPMIGGKRRKMTVHRLVAQAFVLGYFPDAHVDHLDGNKLNNRADNLEWVTIRENTKRQWANGLVDLRGDNHPTSKLTKEQAAAIKVLADAGFPGSLIGEWFGVGRATVYAIKSGTRWRETLEQKVTRTVVASSGYEADDGAHLNESDGACVPK